MSSWPATIFFDKLEAMLQQIEVTADAVEIY